MKIGRRSIRLGVVAVLIALLVFASRHAVLRTLGSLLVVEDPLQPTEVAIVTSDAGWAGLIEAADLYREQHVVRIALPLVESGRVGRELRRRGVEITSTIQILEQLGVPATAVTNIGAGEGGTTDFTQAVATWCATNGVKRLLVISAATHSRRIRRTLHRAFGNMPPQIVMRIPRHEAFDAADWWLNRTTLRSGIFEIQKLLYDLVQHPVS